MKTKTLMLFLVSAILSLMVSCGVPINPNWTPQEQARVQESNAQMAQGVGVGLAGLGVALLGASELRNSGHGGYWHGGRHYGYRGYRHGRYYYY